MKNELTIGMPVQAVDGRVGDLVQIIAEPEGQEPTYLIVRLDRDPPKEVVVPVALVEGVAGGAVGLDTAGEALQGFPDYEAVTGKTTGGRDLIARLRAALPPYRPFTEAATAKLRQRAASDRPAEVGTGMAVYDRAGSEVGQVQGLIGDAERQEASHLILRVTGRPTDDPRLVPADLVDYVSGSRLYLLVESDYLAGLPIYRSEPD